MDKISNDQINVNQNPPFNIFNKLKITDINPNGWLREFLERQKTGLTGNIQVAGYPFNTCMWAGEKIQASTEDWWPYEQTAYYIDGVNRLGLLLKDKSLIQKANENTRYVMEHLDSIGRIGTELSGKWWRWPYASFNRAYMSDYELSKDDKIIKMLHKHYLTFTAEDFADDLELANVEEICWLYGITKDDNLIRMAKESYNLFKSNSEYRNRAGSDIQFASDMVPNHHGVVYLELVKIPAILYSYTGKNDYLKEAINGIETMEKYHMLISGLPSSIEHFQGKTELSGSETCNTATFPYTYGYLLRTCGNASLGDKIEKAVFNAGIGSITKDFKAHQYFSAPNQFIATLNSNGYGYHPHRMAYLPGHDTECCTGNVNRFMPYYVEQMWLSSLKHGLVASLFGPCSVTTNVGKDNRPITITEETEYPFSDKINFKMQMDKDISFPFYIRIPEWCKTAQIWMNGNMVEEKITPGTFFKLEKTFSNRDLITLIVPMEVTTSNWRNKGVGIERGPLVYSYPISAIENVVTNYEKSTPDFPAIERRPKIDWNYAIALSEDKKEDIEFIQNDSKGYPWDVENSPVKIKVPVKRVSNWHLKEYYDESIKAKVITTPGFPDEIITENKTEYIELVPYGSTLLRLTVFPKENFNSNDKKGENHE